MVPPIGKLDGHHFPKRPPMSRNNSDDGPSCVGCVGNGIPFRAKTSGAQTSNFEAPHLVQNSMFVRDTGPFDHKGHKLSVPQIVQIIGPRLHDLLTFLQVLCFVVYANYTCQLMGKLTF